MIVQCNEITTSNDGSGFVSQRKQKSLGFLFLTKRVKLKIFLKQ